MRVYATELITAWKTTCRGPEIPRYGPVFFENTGKSGSVVFHDTWRVCRLSGTVFFPIRTFSVARKIRRPDTSLKRGVSRPGYCLIRLDLLRITAYRGRTQHIKLSRFTLIPCYVWMNFHGTASIMGVRYPKLHGTWPVNIGYSTVRNVSLEIPLSDIPWYVKCHLRFPERIFHGTWSIIWDSPYWIFYETKAWEGISVSWKGTLHPMYTLLQIPFKHHW